MKAKTIDNSPHGFDTCIYDNEDYPTGYYVEDLPNKERADEYTSKFNSDLSAHVSQETDPLLAEIDRLKKEVERLGSDKWISEQEERPDIFRGWQSEPVLTLQEDGKMKVRIFDYELSRWSEDLHCKITHWQSLPQPK